MDHYTAQLEDAKGRGWRVPITEPVDHEAWLQYWATLEARDFDGAFQQGQPAPQPPDNITFMERTEARKQGRTKYWTGRACANGHMVPRYTASGSCGACVTASQRRLKPVDTITFRALIHKDDEEAMWEMVKWLNAGRGL